MYAIEASRIWDVDITGHLSQPLSTSLIDSADLILAMTPQHLKEVLRLNKDAAEKTYLLKNFPDPAPGGESVADPIGQDLERYNQTFLEIGEYLGKSLGEIVKKVDEKFDEE
jgi:protein-tyrosine phosphatase